MLKRKSMHQIKLIMDSSRVQQDSSCEICFQPFSLSKRQPIIICPQFHIICSGCLSGLTQNNSTEKFVCPFCRHNCSTANLSCDLILSLKRKYRRLTQLQNSSNKGQNEAKVLKELEKQSFGLCELKRRHTYLPKIREVPNQNFFVPSYPNNYPLVSHQRYISHQNTMRETPLEYRTWPEINNTQPLTFFLGITISSPQQVSIQFQTNLPNNVQQNQSANSQPFRLSFSIGQMQHASQLYSIAFSLGLY